MSIRGYKATSEGSINLYIPADTSELTLVTCVIVDLRLLLQALNLI